MCDDYFLSCPSILVDADWMFFFFVQEQTITYVNYYENEICTSDILGQKEKDRDRKNECCIQMKVIALLPPLLLLLLLSTSVLIKKYIYAI